MKAVFDKTITLLTQEINSKNATIQTVTLPYFYCNSIEISSVFQNLIQNSLKYNESTTPLVQLTTTFTDTHFKIHFKDNGIGISPEYHEQIFEFFKRLHTSIEYPGTGLGLGLCKKIIEKYNGSIEIESVLSEYSIFTIILPLTGIEKNTIIPPLQ